MIKILEKVLFRNKDVVEEIMKLEDLFIRKTPEEIVFGYVDPVMKLIHDEYKTLLPSPIFSLVVSVRGC